MKDWMGLIIAGVMIGTFLLGHVVGFYEGEEHEDVVVALRVMQSSQADSDDPDEPKAIDPTLHGTPSPTPPRTPFLHKGSETPCPPK